MRCVTFASGSTGNCALVSEGKTHILIDAGISMRRISRALAQLGLSVGDIAGVLITHDHRDHTAALAMMAKRGEPVVYAQRTTANHLCWSTPGIEKIIKPIQAGLPFRLGALEALAFNTSHDAEGSVGYRISGEAEFGFCTDTGCVTDEMLSALSGVDAAVIETNHDEEMLRYGSYPYYLKRRILSDRGHLSNETGARLAAELCSAGAVKLILAHLSRENNRPELALAAVTASLEGRGLTAEVSVAPEDGLCSIEFEGRNASCWRSSSSAAAG